MNLSAVSVLVIDIYGHSLVTLGVMCYAISATLDSRENFRNINIKKSQISGKSFHFLLK